MFMILIDFRWSVIASHLQGRTDNDVKNYWNTKMKKKLMAAKTNKTCINSTTSNNICYREFPSNSMHLSYQNAEFPLPMNINIIEENVTSCCSTNYLSTVTLPNSQLVPSSAVSPASFSQENNGSYYGSWHVDRGDQDDDESVLELGSGSCPTASVVVADQGDFLGGFDDHFLEEIKNSDEVGSSNNLVDSISDLKAQKDDEQFYYQSFANLLSKEL